MTTALTIDTLSNYIGGRLVPPAEGRYLEKIDPATGALLSQVPDSDEDDVNAAVAAADGAFGSWARLPAAERSRWLMRIADEIERDLTPLAAAESADTGKPVKLAARLDIPRAVQNFRFFATAILHTSGEAYSTDDAALNYTVRKPRGVAGLIAPWNLPLYLLSWKIAPALATGNTVVAKPSELTPATAAMVAAICQRIGLPAGVLNIVHGLGPKVGSAIVRHRQVPAISFTGGTTTGATIASQAAPFFKKLTLEMGGKNPTIIFGDADLDRDLPAILDSAFLNQGEICLCGSRILVERSIYQDFVERFTAAAKTLRVGDPLDEHTDIGPLISAGHRQKVLRFARLAREEGGTVALGGGPPGGLPDRVTEGFFVGPTIITGLSMSCRTNQEEIFGPFVTITPFDDERQAIELANTSHYGLAASLWTSDLERAHRVAEAVECGTVWINCWLLRDLRVPFGGMRHSGLGREGGNEALRFFTEVKTVCLKKNRNE